MIPAVAVFLFVMSTVMGAYWAFVVRPEEQATGVLRRRLRKPVSRGVVESPLLKGDKELSAVHVLDTMLRRMQRVAVPLEVLVEQSGARLTVGTLVLMSACCAVAGFLVGQLVFRMLPVALVAAPIAAFIPYFVLRIKRTRRVLRFEEQFPEALDLLARSLRAGHALTSGIALVAEEMPIPVGPEFQLLYDRQNFGMPFPDALRDFGHRIPVIDAKFFVTAVLIQRESGGNLAEVLTNLSSVIRERFRVKRQVRVLSAHGRITGWILSGLPPALAFAFLISSDKHIQTLLGDPLGRQMIVAALALQLIGMFIIRKIVQIEY